MAINLANFQLNAIKSLLERMDEPCRDIVLKSPTGSGKTIILTQKLFLFGLRQARATWKNKAKQKWINISIMHKQNYLPTL